MAKPSTTDVKNDQISDFVDRSAKNDQLEQIFSHFSKLSDSVFQVLIVSTAPTISATPSQNNEKINHLTDIMQSLALSVRTLQENVGIPLFISQPRAKPANTSSKSHILTDYQGGRTNNNRPEGANRCMYCWKTDHYLKRHFQVFRDDPNSNLIHQEDKRKVCLEPYLPCVRPIYIRREKPSREFVADAENYGTRLYHLSMFQP